MTITHPGHPYRSQQAVVIRAKGGAHLDLRAKFEGGYQMSVDAGWTYFWTRAGERPPGASRLLDVRWARRFIEMAGRLRREGREELAMLQFVLGQPRSGKSLYAERLMQGHPGSTVYIGTLPKTRAFRAVIELHRERGAQCTGG